MLKISVIGLKGGVGKTSVTLGLAGAATLRGMANLVVDLDPQGNASSILAAAETETTMADVLAHPTMANFQSALATCDWEIGPGEVDVIPATPELVEFDAYKASTFKPRLAKVSQFFEGYDLVFFDLPPSHGALVRDALSISDIAVIVTTPSFFGGQGVERAIETIETARKESNARLKFGGVIVNRVRSVMEEHTYRQKELVSLHGRSAILSPAIPERAAVQQAESIGQPIQTISTAGGREVREIMDTLLTKIMKTAKG